MLSRFLRGFHDLSIKRKLTLIITLTSGLALALACAGFVLHDVLTFRRVTLENTDTLAAIVGNHTAAALTFNDPSAATEMLGALAGEPHVIAAVLYKDGRPFASYLRAGATNPLPTVAPAGSFARFADGRLELARVVHANGEDLGVLHLVADLGALDERLRRYFAIAASLLLVAMLAAYGLSSAFQRVISRPLSELVGIARRVSVEKDYGMRAARHSRDEIGQLIDGFNEMLAQIQQRDAALRAAHDELELRVRARTRELERQIAERLGAEKALQQQLTRISLLNQIATALSDHQDLDSIVRVVLMELEAHLPVDFGSVSLFDNTTGTLQVAVERRRKHPPEAADEPLAPRGPFGPSLAGLEDCRTGQQIFFPDAAQATQPLLLRFAAAGLRSVVAAPLMLERRLFGLLVVARAEPAAFTSGESEFLRMLGEQVVVAGSQARLYTELQHAYTELRQSQSTMMQQERLRALGQMASGIAHDINNTLTPIVTFAEILLAQEKGLSKAGRAYLGNILTAGEDISTIVSRLREFYRPRDTHEAPLPVEVNALLQQVAELTRPRWRDMPLARGVVIQLRTELTAELPSIFGNQAELRESLINLVLNAVDAMPEGGVLTLRTRTAPATPGELGEAVVVVEVGDTGVGMDDETRQRCLEPFFSTKGQRGTGLGLAMVYGVMERHAGRIEVESAPGAGTTMRLLFPSRPHARDASVNPFDTSGKMPEQRILCIDDEPMLRNVLAELFLLDGHAVTVAESGEAGLELFRHAAKAGRPFDVVVTDLGMPRMDGRQLAQALKREAPDTPVVLLTGWGKIMREDGDRPSVVDAVLTKPPRLKELRATLAQIITRRSPSAR